MKQKENKKLYKVIDEDGVIVQEQMLDESANEYIFMVTKSEIEKADRQKQGLAKKKIKDENLLKFNEFNKDRGGFYMVTYVKNTLLFGEIEGVEDTDIPKLMYLATFLDYVDRNNYMLVKRVQKGNEKFNQVMDRDEIIEHLKMSIVKGRSWLKRMNEIGMLNIIDKKYIELNSKYFLKGEIEGNETFENAKKHGNFTRIFIKTVKDLYEGNTTRKHKQLSHIFRLIPLAHIETNVVCKDIFSDKKEEIYYSFKEVVDLLNGESTEPKHRAKLEKDLHSFKIMFNGEEIRPMRVVTLDRKDKDELTYSRRNYVVINPILSYRGDYDDMVMIIRLFFAKQFN